MYCSLGRPESQFQNEFDLNELGKSTKETAAISVSNQKVDTNCVLEKTVPLTKIHLHLHSALNYKHRRKGLRGRQLPREVLLRTRACEETRKFQNEKHTLEACLHLPSLLLRNERSQNEKLEKPRKEKFNCFLSSLISFTILEFNVVSFGMELAKIEKFE